MAVGRPFTPGVGGTGVQAQGGQIGYGVGVVSFLDSEASKVSKYWRNLELTGTQGFVGKQLSGLWGAGQRGVRYGGRYVGPSRDVSHQQFFPWKRPTKNRAGRVLVPPVGIVEREIKAQHSYEKAWARWDPVAREREAIAQALEGNEAFFSPGEGGFKGATGPTRVTAAARASFLGRTGFLQGSVSSPNLRSLRRIDEDFRSSITETHRLLAAGLAAVVAEQHMADRLRPQTVSGRTLNAIRDPRNRFPR